MTDHPPVPHAAIEAALVAADDPILRLRASDAPGIVSALGETLLRTMRQHKGAGLAAPQIGRSVRVFVMEGDELPYLFADPVIVERSAETDVQDEGCLSLPGVIVPVRRNLSVVIEARSGVHTLRGLQARVAQHEMDHLDGVLITDRAPPAQPHLIRAWIEGLSDTQAHELGMTMANAMYQTPEWAAKLIRSSLFKLVEPKEP